MLRFPEEQLWKLCGQVSHAVVATTFFSSSSLDLQQKLCSQNFFWAYLLITFFLSRDQCVVVAYIKTFFFQFLFPECLLCLTFFPFLELPHKKSFLFQWKSYRDRNCYKILILSQTNRICLQKYLLLLLRVEGSILQGVLDNLWGYCWQNYAEIALSRSLMANQKQNVLSRTQGLSPLYSWMAVCETFMHQTLLASYSKLRLSTINLRKCKSY